MEILRHVVLIIVAHAAVRFHRDQSGATAIEYALLAAGIAAACITAILYMGDSIELMMTKLGTVMDDIADAPET